MWWVVATVVQWHLGCAVEDVLEHAEQQFTTRWLECELVDSQLQLLWYFLERECHVISGFVDVLLRLLTFSRPSFAAGLGSLRSRHLG